MRRPLLMLVLAPCLAGCFYSSPVPLDGPEAAPFDEGLLGSWTAPEDADVGPITVTRASEHEYRVAWVEEETGQDGQTRREAVQLQAWLTSLDGARFLNFADEDGSFAFARCTVGANEVRLRFIADRSNGEERGLAERFETSAELRAAVRARLDDPLLYEEEELVLVRRSGP